MMQLIKKFQFISLIVFMTGLTLFTPQVYAHNFFYEYQCIPTQGASDWKSFTIGSDTFLAVANSYNNSKHNIDSKIYKHNVVNMTLGAGWSMISLPVVSESLVLSDVFPGAVVVYGYECNVGYVRIPPDQKLEVGKGYWILLNKDRSYTLTGESIYKYTSSVQNR